MQNQPTTLNSNQGILTEELASDGESRTTKNCESFRERGVCVCVCVCLKTE